MDDQAQPDPDLAQAPVPSSWQNQRKGFLRTALPLAFLSSLALLASLIFLGNVGLGWLTLLATVIWAIVRHQRRHAGPISPGTGARMGAMMGLFTFVFSFLLLALSISIRHNGSELRERLVKALEQAAAQNPQPQIQEAVRLINTSQGLMLFVGFLLLVFFIVFVVSATATGAVTAAIVIKKPGR